MELRHKPRHILARRVRQAATCEPRIVADTAAGNTYNSATMIGSDLQKDFD